MAGTMANLRWLFWSNLTISPIRFAGAVGMAMMTCSKSKARVFSRISSGAPITGTP